MNSNGDTQMGMRPSTGPRQYVLLTNGAMKTASVPTATAAKEAKSAHDSITTTSYISHTADEMGSSMSPGGSHVIQAAPSPQRNSREAQTGGAHTSPRA